jgi:hypothetical protein
VAKKFKVPAEEDIENSQAKIEEKIARGLAQLDQGQGIPDDQARTRVHKKRKK